MLQLQLLLTFLFISSNLAQIWSNEASNSQMSSASKFCTKPVQKSMKILVEPRQEKTVKCVEIYKHTEGSIANVGHIAMSRNKWEYDEKRMKLVHGGDLGLKDYFSRQGKNSDCFLYKKQIYKEVKITENDEKQCCLGYQGENCNLQDRNFYGYCYSDNTCSKNGLLRQSIDFLPEKCCQNSNVNRNYFVLPYDINNCHSCLKLEDAVIENQDVVATDAEPTETPMTEAAQSDSINIEELDDISQKNETSQTLNRLRKQLNSAGIYISGNDATTDSLMLPMIGPSILRQLQNVNRATCHTWFGKYFLTFDNRYFATEKSTCWYLLAKSNNYQSHQLSIGSLRSSHENDQNNLIPNWSIALKYSDNDEINFKITINDNYFLLENNNWFLNGHKVHDKKINMFDIHIRKLSDDYFLLTSSHVDTAIQFSKYHMMVHLPEDRSSLGASNGRSGLSGLCGNFNFNPADDLPEGNFAKHLAQFKILDFDPVPCFDSISNLNLNLRVGF